MVSGSHARRVELLRLPPYDFNMARLIELDALCREIVSVDCLADYAERLAAIMRQPAPWSGWRFVAMGFVLSASVALLLRGGWVEALCGGMIGMLFVAGYQLFARIPRLGPAVPVILCALAALGAQGLAQLLPQQVPFISAVAGIVLLLPGFMITVAMSEIATQNYLAGTGRLTGAFVLLFLMGAGLAIGTQVSLAGGQRAAPGGVTALPAGRSVAIAGLASRCSPCCSALVLGPCLGRVLPARLAVYSLVVPKWATSSVPLSGTLPWPAPPSLQYLPAAGRARPEFPA